MNSAGNIVGVIPKDFIIVLIENHHWVDVNQLDSQQRRRLPRMFRRSSTVNLEDEAAGADRDDWFTEDTVMTDPKLAEDSKQVSKQESAKSPLKPAKADSVSPEEELRKSEDIINRSSVKGSLLRESVTLKERGSEFTTSMS